MVTIIHYTYVQCINKNMLILSQNIKGKKDNHRTPITKQVGRCVETYIKTERNQTVFTVKVFQSSCSLSFI